MRAFPAGVLEVTPDGTNFIAFFDMRRLAVAFAGGVFLGLLLAKKFQCER